MFFRFSTFGPYKLQRHKGHVSELALDTLWKEIKVEGLSEAIGIYIFAIRNSDNSLEPWYVGKTDKGFKKRILQHWKLFALLAEKSPKGDLELFLIPRVSSNRGKFKKPANKKLPSIDDLETMIIGSCFSKNPHVINEKKTSWQKELHVPGYFNDQQTDPKDEAAKELQLMLKKG